MKVEDIIALAKAGFSMEQIGTINKVMKEEPAPTPQPETPHPEPTTAPQPQDDPVLQELLGIKTLLQKQNIKKDGYSWEPEKSVNDILASMIAPPKKEGGM